MRSDVQSASLCSFIGNEMLICSKQPKRMTTPSCIEEVEILMTSSARVPGPGQSLTTVLR